MPPTTIESLPADLLGHALGMLKSGEALRLATSSTTLINAAANTIDPWLENGGVLYNAVWNLGVDEERALLTARNAFVIEASQFLEERLAFDYSHHRCYSDGNALFFSTLSEATSVVLGPHLASSSIVAIADGCRRLRRLTFSGRCDSVTDAEVDAITAKCPDLLTLQLGEMHKVTDHGVQLMVDRLTFLKELRFAGGRFISRPPHLNGCKSLVLLELTCLNSLTNDRLSMLLADCPQLRTLQLSDCALFETFTAASHPEMAEVCIHDCPHITTIQVNNCPALIAINVRNCLTLVSLFIDDCPLRSLSLIDCRDLMTSCLEPQIAAGAWSLARLDIGGVQLMCDTFLDNVAQNCLELHRVRLENMNIGGFALTRFVTTRCTLTTLTLCELQCVSDSTVVTIIRCGVSLEQLEIRGCKLDSPVIESSSSLRSIAFLSTRVDSPVFRRCPSLRSVRLVDQTLGGAVFNDLPALVDVDFWLGAMRSSPHFGGCASLRMLNLTSLATFQPPTIEDCPRFRSIFVNKRCATDTDGRLHDFKLRNPAVQVRFEDP